MTDIFAGEVMNQEKELTGIERELVLQYLRDDNVPLTITLEEKPLMTETELSENKTELPSADERVPASAVFPVAIPSQQITVLDKGIILLKNQVRSVQPFLGKTVRVQFYFNHLGLYFITTMKECSQGLAIVVPSSIKRVPDVIVKCNYDFSATLSFSSGTKSVTLECIPEAGYDLFVQPRWDSIETEVQKPAKKLLEKFVSEVKSGLSAPVGNGLQLINVVRFLTQRNLSLPPAIEGRCRPFGIIYVDTSRIVLCAEGECASLSCGETYLLSMTFALSSSRLLKRRIDVQCEVEKVYSDDSESGRSCISLKFDDLKKEDDRFLYERLSGKKLE